MEGENSATGGQKGENSFILGRTPSQASEMSYTSDTKQLVELERKDDVLRGNIPMTSFNFINSIIGSGIIGVPYALKQAGFVMGIFLLIITALLNDRSIILLVEAGKLSNTDSYQDMIMVACGRPGFYLLTLLQFLYPLIAMISYNVIIGDTVTKIIVRIGKAANVGSTVLGNRQFIICLSTLMVTLPLSLYRNIAQLSKWAFLSIIMVFFILVTVCIRTTEFVREIPPTDDAWNFANYNIAQAIGIMAFAYMCHHNTFLIHGSLENPTHQRWSLVTHLSIGFSMTLMLILGILGYVSFTGHTQGDLLENYCHEDDLMNVSRFMFAFSIMLTYPIECFVTREVIENAFFPSKDPSPAWRHLCVTIAVVLLTVAISMTTDCLGIVLTFNGVMVASPLAFIIPPVCVMKLREEPILSKRNIIPIIIATFGTLVTAFGIIVAIINMSEGFSCSHGTEMAYCADSVASANTTISPLISANTTSQQPFVPTSTPSIG
ncbi:putative sodium-coupled neutral amino acid transporter 11 isoform X2 [Ostrea edulis]|uniref:putative sodium-coupled neutral amino acid transporter 11 isoform X2 n=1 Tax=Ostrea edulis TaxID=37623 RepID=UPI002095DB73|nr:putative sodium-coupled neutral amino acid transporter 11 isoform X2 [Ostrea edulis]XP_056008121.1 putative sodium-coupled neutral amino acid transporter 11 isoform X2 [Ostrea edulis]